MGLRHLLVTWSILVLASQGLAQGCEGWNTGPFFSTATLTDVVTCIMYGADLNARGEYGMTPLHFAAGLNDNSTITAALIGAGAELEARSEEGHSPLHLAARFNLNPFVIEVLLDAKTDVRARDEEGDTPLHLVACCRDNPAITTALLEAGAEVNARNERGRTPLHSAALTNGNPAIIEILLDAGANRRARDDSGNTPWDYAEGREGLQGSDAYQRLEPRRGLIGRIIGRAGAAFGVAREATSKVLELLWDILLKSFGMAREVLELFGEGGEWMVSMAANPTIFLETYSSLSRFAGNLNWSNIDPTKYLRAGMRGGVRSIEAAKGVWETIPAGVRAQGQGATKAYLQNMDWSHFEPYLPGLRDGPEHGIFEDSSLNRARGRAPMTTDEIEAARRVWKRINVSSIIDESAKIGARTALASAVVAGMVAVLDYGLQYQEGKITADEMLSKEVALSPAMSALRWL